MRAEAADRNSSIDNHTTIKHTKKHKAPDAATHRWTVYVRGANNEDLSPLLSKVTFQLHETFLNPQRAVTAPPFELTEEGWGEFELGVTLHFQPDSQEPPVELRHFLRLYEDGEPQGAPLSASKKPVVSVRRAAAAFFGGWGCCVWRVYGGVLSPLALARARWAARGGGPGTTQGNAADHAHRQRTT